MSGLLNKLRKKHGTARVATAVVYFVAALAFFANHSCEVSKRNYRHSHFGKTDHHSSGKPWIDPQFEMALQQNDGPSEKWCFQAQCIACLFSTVTKSIQPRVSSQFINPGVLRFFQILPLIKVVRKSEWLSSISLRAPPITVS